MRFHAGNSRDVSREFVDKAVSGNRLSDEGFAQNRKFIMPTDPRSEINSAGEAIGTVDVVGFAGIGFALIAAGLYALLFFMLHKLPASRNELQQVSTNAPALTRLLVVAASAALLNVVALILCLTGFLAPRRPRTLSAIGATLTTLMLLAVFSVVIVSLVVSPAP